MWMSREEKKSKNPQPCQTISTTTGAGTMKMEKRATQLKLFHNRQYQSHRAFGGGTHALTTWLKKELKEENDLEPTFSSSFNFLWSFYTETKVEKRFLSAFYLVEVHTNLRTYILLHVVGSNYFYTKKCNWAKGVFSDDDTMMMMTKKKKTKCEERLFKKEQRDMLFQILS